MILQFYKKLELLQDFTVVKMLHCCRILQFYKGVGIVAGFYSFVKCDIVAGFSCFVKMWHRWKIFYSVKISHCCKNFIIFYVTLPSFTILQKLDIVVSTVKIAHVKSRKFNSPQAVNSEWYLYIYKIIKIYKLFHLINLSFH